MCNEEAVWVGGTECTGGVLTSRPPPLIVGGTVAVILVEAGVSSRCCSSGLNIPVRVGGVHILWHMATIPSYGSIVNMFIIIARAYRTYSITTSSY